MADLDLAAVDRAVEAIGRGADRVVPILQAIQEEYRYLPEPALRRVCEISDIRPTDIVGVSSFFDHFRFEPVGEHVVRVCCGTACHVKGSELIWEALRDRLGLQNGQHTDAAGRFTVEKVACVGCCTLAPVVQARDDAFGFIAPDGVGRMLEQVTQRAGIRRSTRETVPEGPRDQPEIRVGLGSCCASKGSAVLYDNLKVAAREVGIAVRVQRVGCVGMCHRTPLVEVVNPGQEPHLYAEVKPEEAVPIVRRHFRPRGVGQRIKAAFTSTVDAIIGDEGGGTVERYAIDVRDPAVNAFLGRQRHIATEHFDAMDPLDLDQYRELGGFQAFERVLREVSADGVIDELDKSGLRGRGGAGFPTGRKWRAARDAVAEVEAGPNYVICNGDEGDPGAFMDRMILESAPFRVIEGLAIAAYTAGANQGYFYIREEYGLAVRRVREALRRCRDAGLLGDDVLGSGFRLDLDIFQGAGAFVCGEETALIASIEGRRGMPTLRPPFPVERGLHDRPTLINNVETLALIPWIMRFGAGAFAALGTERSRGTKVFALAGKIARGGLIEVPMGITIREIVEEIGGGIADGRELKAVQVGGPSGGCIPASLADTPVDYEALLEVGAMMGSGGLVVLDDSDCMVDMARYFLSFTQEQSCGKCSYCRVGTRRLLDIMERLCAGKGRKKDLEVLDELGRTVQSGSICGLGRTAPNPVLTTLEYFHDEYEAHIEGRCPAGKCRGLISYSVKESCTGCTLCARICPVDAIEYAPFQMHAIDLDKCTRCDACRSVCPEDAILVK